MRRLDRIAELLLVAVDQTVSTPGEYASAQALPSRRGLDMWNQVPRLRRQRPS
jgi:hypothetical protein